MSSAIGQVNVDCNNLFAHDRLPSILESIECCERKENAKQNKTQSRPKREVFAIDEDFFFIQFFSFEAELSASVNVTAVIREFKINFC